METTHKVRRPIPDKSLVDFIFKQRSLFPQWKVERSTRTFYLKVDEIPDPLELVIRSVGGKLIAVIPGDNLLDIWVYDNSQWSVVQEMLEPYDPENEKSITIFEK